jgi:Na+/H+ antiporter NhaA
VGGGRWEAGQRGVLSHSRAQIEIERVSIFISVLKHISLALAAFFVYFFGLEELMDGQLFERKENMQNQRRV